MSSAFAFFGFLAALLGISKGVYGFFQWFLRQRGDPALFVVCGLLASFTGGLFWNLVCRIQGWPYHMGGSGNEPVGLHAFVWGAFTAFPVAFFGLMVRRKSRLGDRASLLAWILSTDALGIVLYAVCSGAGAALFYGLGFRPFVEGMRLGHEAEELILVLFWAGVISISAAASFWLLYPLVRYTHGRGGNYLAPLVQVPFSMALSFLAVLFFLCVAPAGPAFDQLRGLSAGLGLRFGLFCGIVAGATEFGFRSILLRRP